MKNPRLERLRRKMREYHRHHPWRLDGGLFILKTSVGRARVCGFGVVWQGATTRNGRSIPRRSNAAGRRQKRAIGRVAAHPMGERPRRHKRQPPCGLSRAKERSTEVFRFIPHAYPEAEAEPLSWWDDVGFMLDGRRVIVWWRHPRCVYHDAIERQAMADVPAPSTPSTLDNFLSGQEPGTEH